MTTKTAIPAVALMSLMLSLLLATASCGGGGGGGASNNATLSSLIVSAASLSPVFDANTTSYTVAVSSAASSTTVTPTAADGTATITVSGATVASGSASAAIALAVGPNNITIIVTAQDGITTQTYTVIVTRFASIELIDPTPGASDGFGTRAIVLGNGNIVVTDPLDSSIVADGGAVHLYSPLSPTPIASIYGDVAMDRLGSARPIVLSNNNFVVTSVVDDEGGIVDAGSVRLVSGTTGAQIGATLAGDVANDRLGAGGVTVLPNNNFVVSSLIDDEGGIVDAGSVRLVSGTTGAQIGATIAGDVADDNLGSRVVALSNNNFVVASIFDDEGGIVDAGSVRLFSGTTGAQIGATLAGDVASDFLGSGGAIALPNNNFVVASPRDDEGGVVDAGSVRLFSGTTGAQIGATLAGDLANDSLGSGGPTALSNNNFVLASENDSEGGIVEAGSVRLISGTTGAQIGVTISGDVTGDNLGSGGVTVLPNNNFTVASTRDDEGGIVDAGSVRLISGTTGAQIGATLAGDLASDNLGSMVLALSNNNFVVSSFFDDEGGIVDAGSVRLISGTTGVQIGATISGDVASDNLGSIDAIALPNNNFVVVSPLDDEGGIVDAGSVRLVSGSTGVQIGATIAGDVASDRLGSNGVTGLLNNFAIVSQLDDEGGIVDAGSVRLVSGSTGVQIGATITGAVSFDISSATTVVVGPQGAFTVVAMAAWNNGALNSGRVLLIAD